MSRILFGVAIISIISVGTAACYSIINGSKKKEKEHQLQLQQLQEQLNKLELEINDKSQQLEQRDPEIEILEDEFNQDMEAIEREFTSMKSKSVDATKVATMAINHYDDIEKQHEEFKDQACDLRASILGTTHQLKCQVNEMEKEIDLLRKEKDPFDESLSSGEESDFLLNDYDSDLDSYVD